VVAKTAADIKKRVDAERKEKLKSKPLHGKYLNVLEELAEEGAIDLNRSWQWLKAGFLTKSTEGFIIAAEEQALRTKSVKANIDTGCQVCQYFHYFCNLSFFSFFL
jgi:hypothetical protein